MPIIILTAITVASLILVASTVFSSRYSRIAQIAFFIGSLSTAIVITGDSLCILRPALLGIWKRVVFTSEALMVTSWLLFSVSYARLDYWGAMNKYSKLLLMASPVFICFFSVIPVGDFFYSPEFEVEKILFLEDTGYVFNILLLLYSVVSVINLEATLRSSSGTGKWHIKYILIGTGSIVAMNIFYYSYALLYRLLNMNLLPVREGVMLVSILLTGIFMLRHKAMNVEVAISRRVVYKSLGLLVIGSYLLGLGITGEGMRYLGPRVGKNITTFLGFVGAIIVLTVFLSERLRRKAAVMISKNFFSSKYDYREQWLRFTQRISLKHSPEELLESIAEGFKDAIGTRGSSIWLKEKDSGEYLIAGRSGSDLINLKPGKELIEFLQDRQWVLNVHDRNCKEIVDKDREFIEKTEASLMVPFLHIGRLIGFIILKEGMTDDEYNYEDYDLMKTLAKQSALAIMNTQLSGELTKAKEMEAMGKLSSFIIHDLKNSASMLSLIVQNAEEHIDNPDFQRDAIRTVYRSSEKIKDIIGKLKNLPTKTQLVLEYSDLGNCVRSAIDQINLNGSSDISYREAETVYTKIDKDEIMKVIINLVMNAIDASENKAEIQITVGTETCMAFIRVSDKGCGMSADFIEKKLFKPFQTTKKKGLGIGLFQCKAIVEAHSGKLMVESHEGKGTDFAIYLPVKS